MNNKDLNSKVILPLRNHILRTWAGYNFLFSIIQNKDNGYDWIINSFIQIEGTYLRRSNHKNKISPSIRFIPSPFPHDKFNALAFCPFIEELSFSSNIILSKYNNFTNFIIDMLYNGCYVSCVLDQFFRPNRKDQKGFNHTNFIYGYDLDKQLLYLADNFDLGKYCFLNVPFDKIEESFRLVANGQNHVSKIYRLKDADFKFNINMMINLLKDYLLSKNTIGFINELINEKDKYFCGLENYNMLKKYLYDLTSNLEDTALDWRSFCFLIDHKKLMKLRICYLKNKGYILNSKYFLKEINHLEYNANLVLNIFLKYMYSNQQNKINKIISVLDDMKKREQKLLNDLVQELEK